MTAGVTIVLDVGRSRSGRLVGTVHHGDDCAGRAFSFSGTLELLAHVEAAVDSVHRLVGSHNNQPSTTE